MENNPLSQWQYTALNAEEKEQVDGFLRMAETGLRAALSRIKSYHEGEAVLKIIGEFDSTARLLDDAMETLKSSLQTKPK
jgi:hypothetical protein